MERWGEVPVAGDEEHHGRRRGVQGEENQVDQERLVHGLLAAARDVQEAPPGGHGADRGAGGEGEGEGESRGGAAGGWFRGGGGGAGGVGLGGAGGAWEGRARPVACMCRLVSGRTNEKSP